MIGDAAVAAFFAHDKSRNRVEAARELAGLAGGDVWGTLHQRVRTLADGSHPIRPFHWEVEFPEVFSGEQPGFDAIIGNPPFAGKNTIIKGNRAYYLPWLQTLHEGAHGNADLVAHFFRRAFGLLKPGGVMGLIATNTIGQGDTRASGLTWILQNGGAISRGVRRLRWPGEAAVVVSVLHVVKGAASAPDLDGREVRRISAYLVEGDLDVSPEPLAANSGKAFVGSYILGMGFTFDDAAAAKGEAESLATMQALIDKDPRNAERIFPYIGGEEVNTSPTHAHHRYAIDFFDRPLRRDEGLKSWVEMDPAEQAQCRVSGVVPADYGGEVAEDWPDLIEIVRRRVKPDRDKQKRDALRIRWWQYAEKRPGLYRTIKPLAQVLVNSSKAAPQFAIALVPNNGVLTQNLNVFASGSFGALCAMQTRSHEAWARFVGTTMKDDLTYTVDECFRGFPFPLGYERGADIQRLRELHAEMDRAVLEAYARGETDEARAAVWRDLAKRAQPEFIEQEVDEGKKAKTRLDWPQPFKDEVLGRLLDLNAERVAAEKAAGLVAVSEDDVAEEED